MKSTRALHALTRDLAVIGKWRKSAGTQLMEENYSQFSVISMSTQAADDKKSAARSKTDNAKDLKTSALRCIIRQAECSQRNCATGNVPPAILETVNGDAELCRQKLSIERAPLRHFCSIS